MERKGLSVLTSLNISLNIFKKTEKIGSDFWSIYEGEKGLIWYANGAELNYLNPKTGIHQTINKQNGFTDFGPATFYFITQRDENSLWLTGNYGVFIFDYEKGIIAQYNSEKTGEFFIPAKDVHHLYEDKEGVIWLATGDGGLIRWKAGVSGPSTVRLPPSTVMQFTIANGLSSNSLHAVYEDDFNHLWVSSQNGINQFNKSNFQIKNYFLEDGISENEFNRISHYQDEAGMIYFGSVNGITVFDPIDFYNNETEEYNAPLEIISFQQYSSKTDSMENRTVELIRNNKINIQPGDRFFNLKIALLDYEKK